MHYAAVQAHAKKRLSDPAGWLRDLEEARKKDASPATEATVHGRWCDD
jgi:hypothetical protein